VAIGSKDLDAVVVGAGVVGLAVGRALALAGREVTVLEAANAVGTHASSRNSEVIHAGIYYATGSLKAQLCVSGKERLYRYCADNDVNHNRIGKLIVATREEQLEKLAALKRKADDNDVRDLTWLDAAAVGELEPAVRCVGALLSPSTGIVDSHGLMRSYRREIEAHGGRVVLSSPVLGGRPHRDGIVLEVGGAEPVDVDCRTVINCGGLFAQDLARAIIGCPPDTIPERRRGKGHYFVYARAAPFSRLVYPLPVPGGLGIHVTLDLAGRVRFGPDVCWVDEVDYGFDESRAPSFYAAIREYFPDLRDGDLLPGYTGIRSKVPGAPDFQDFVIHGPTDHGIAGLVNLFGIDSPGLTSSLAIADYVLERTAA
jgi:L-2-hydroxyglutarate oxidase LhgO